MKLFAEIVLVFFRILFAALLIIFSVFVLLLSIVFPILLAVLTSMGMWSLLLLPITLINGGLIFCTAVKIAKKLLDLD
jgi:hypothetical protein